MRRTAPLLADVVWGTVAAAQTEPRGDLDANRQVDPAEAAAFEQDQRVAQAFTAVDGGKLTGAQARVSGGAGNGLDGTPTAPASSRRRDPSRLGDSRADNGIVERSGSRDGHRVGCHENWRKMMKRAISTGASGWRRSAVLLAALAVGLMGILFASGPAGADDHLIPETVLKKGARELQAGTKVAESSWNEPAGDGLCVNENVVYRTRFPETDSVAAGSELRVRISKAQRPDSFGIAAYKAVDGNGAPVGEGRPLKRSLERVVRGGETVAWDALFSVNRPARDYYLISEGHWRDREGCGGDQFAFWSFHVETRA